MKTATYNFSVVMERDKDGYFAYCPELQGCYTQGDNYDEALSNIKEAIKLHIESRMAHNEEIPQHANEDFLISRVAVAV